MQITVIVKPGSSQNKIEESTPGVIAIWTHARAHDGEANKAVIKAIANFYQIPKTSIKLLRGATSKTKVFEIPSVSQS